MIKWLVKDYNVDGSAKVIGAWPNGFALQLDIGMTEDIASVLHKLNEAAAVSYIQMAQGFLLSHVNFQDKKTGEEEGIPVGVGVADSGTSKVTESKIQL